jgi:Zn-dependent alcohol dehydrogenase
MGCRVAGACRVVAIAVPEQKLELAAKVGATDAVNAALVDVVPEVVELSRGYFQGRLTLDEMLPKRIALDRVNSGLRELQVGRVVRDVVVFAQ